MKKATLYSTSAHTKARVSAQPATDPGTPPPPPSWRARAATQLRRYERLLLVATSVLITVALFATYTRLHPPPRALTQKDIDSAVVHTLENLPPASPAAKAYDIVSPSVVRVLGTGDEREDGKAPERGVGTGVVIVDSGIILTNLHVVSDAKRIKVTFADGFESDANVVSVQPENDLAVIKATKIPDDLMSATLRSTADLNVGDQVVAVGFPFGIGPSASAGVVSGLAREYRSPEGKRVLTNLIQFDAAANPGNSGGPLVTMDGEVVGIVTAILNPTEQRVFVGIGFAVPIENAASAVGLSPF
ncbi:MAG: trypsin-like peptidase domain-containing protein [Casimicrobiaceae bacterium]